MYVQGEEFRAQTDPVLTVSLPETLFLILSVCEEVQDPVAGGYSKIFQLHNELHCSRMVLKTEL